jgi:EAL domain-containing protein (putative c-di-GMP-specific phosphodiesterase class I)
VAAAEGVVVVALTPSRLVRLLVAAVAVQCLLAAAVGVTGAAGALGGRGRAVDLLATSGLAWVVVLAAVAVLVGRRVRDLDRQLTAQGAHLEEATAPRRRLAGIVHRTERLLADPDQPSVALQPIVDAATGRWVAVEALARFPDGRRPDLWIAEAHEAGIGTALERRVLQRALALLPQLPADVELSVNASPGLVLDPAFARLVVDSGQAAGRLVVEITEHASVTQYEDIRAALLPLRERGVRLAVDDTGAGYSSFAHVLRLRPDVIKMDRSLLADIDHDAARRAFVTAVVLMALELGARVTAEGVETVAELETLATLGVDTVQGFLLARPSDDPAVWARWARRDWRTHVGSVAPTVAGSLALLPASEPLDATYGGRQAD